MFGLFFPVLINLCFEILVGNPLRHPRNDPGDALHEMEVLLGVDPQITKRQFALGPLHVKGMLEQAAGSDERIERRKRGVHRLPAYVPDSGAVKSQLYSST